MKILPVIRTLLRNTPAVVAKCPGGIFINEVPKDSTRPNVQLMLVSGLEEFTHSGPSGLVEDRVRIWSRGRTDQQAGELGEAISTALNGWLGEQSGLRIQLIRKVMTVSDYQEAAGVHRQIDDYAVHWGLA